MRTGDELGQYWIVELNQLIVNPMWVNNRSIAVSDRVGVISPDYRVYDLSDDVVPRFAHHLLRSDEFVSLYRLSVRGQTTYDRRVSKDDFNILPFVLPPTEEQRAIADFLDCKTKAIDDFIQKKERLIELLQEKRQTLITQAVTQGLDPAVPMKDSGIEWLGEIPAHWNLQRVKHLVSFITSGSRGWAEYFSDDGAIFLQSGNLDRQLGLDLSNVQHVQPPKGAEGIRTRVRKDDVLVCITGALTGNVSHVHSDVGEAYVNQHLALVRPKNTLIHPRLLAHALASDFGQHQFWMTQYGGTKQGLGLQDVRDVILPIPPQAEQSDLLEKLEVQLGVLTRLRTRINYQVLRLREYRQALISAAVTGKIDVTRETA